MVVIGPGVFTNSGLRGGHFILLSTAWYELVFISLLLFCSYSEYSYTELQLQLH